MDLTRVGRQTAAGHLSSGHVDERPPVLRRDHEQRPGGPGRRAPSLLHSCSVRTDTPSSAENWDCDKAVRSRFSEIAGSVVIRP